MYLKSEFDSVYKEYNKMIKERSKKLTKIWTYVFAGFFVVLFGLPLIPDFLDKGPGWALYIIYGGLIFVGLSIALLVSIFSISEVPAFEYLYKEIYKKINLEEGTFYDYVPFEKEKWEFNKRGGLFSRYCRIKVKRHVSGKSPNENKFDIFDAIFITGNGQNNHVHFSGIYLITKYKNPSLFQVRSHSKPSRKGVKYNRVEEYNDFRVFVEEGKNMTNTEHKYIDVVNRLKRNLHAKKIYLSLTEDEIHFAYVPKEQIRKQYNITVEKMNQLYTIFLDEISIIDELVETSVF